MFSKLAATFVFDFDMSQTTEVSPTEELSLEPSDVFELPAEKLFERIVLNAERLNSTDVFLLSKENHYEVSVRRMGAIEQLLAVPKEMGTPLANFVRTQAEIDFGASSQTARWSLDV